MKRTWPTLVIPALAVAMAVGGCKRGQQAPAPGATSSSAALSASSAPIASASAPSAQPSRAVGPLPTAESPSIRTTDGVKLGASLWVGGEASAPAVILVHRLAGARSEWDPLVQRLLPPHAPMNLLAIDLRGHGESIQKGGEKHKLTWQGFKTDEFARMAKDVEAAVEFMKKRPGGPPSQLIFVGSDLGGTALVRGIDDAKLSAAGVCLISPGASLRGVDLYKPFGSVMALPNLIVASTGDNVSHDPSLALGKMSKSAQVLSLDSRAHSAEFLGGEKPEMWDAVADWVDTRAGEAPGR